jgi:hypothetical protein
MRNMLEEIFKLRNIFLPHEGQRREALLKNGRKLIHYTSAANAVSIVRKNQVWMRNVRCMNDFMEVEHGFQLLKRPFSPPLDSETERGLRAVTAAIDEVFPGLSDETIKLFNGYLPALRNETYVTCLSEHDASENEFGRLSMWRSYSSNQVGVGLVINPLPLYGLSDTLGAFSSPVHYYADAELRDMFFQVAKNISAERGFLLGKGRDSIKGYFFLVLRSVAMCLKHPGFREEQEWRIMHTRGLDDQGALTLDVECINGVPQPVFKIPLKDEANGGLTGISVPQLIERVIIGPTQFPVAVSDALELELEKAGVSDAGAKIIYSDIPLRT